MQRHCLQSLKSSSPPPSQGLCIQPILLLEIPWAAPRLLSQHAASAYGFHPMLAGNQMSFSKTFPQSIWTAWRMFGGTITAAVMCNTSWQRLLVRLIAHFCSDMAASTCTLLYVSQQPWCFNRKAAASASGMLCAALIPLQPRSSSFVALIAAHQLCTASMLAIMHSPMCLEIEQVPLVAPCKT